MYPKHWRALYGGGTHYRRLDPTYIKTITIFKNKLWWYVLRWPARCLRYIADILVLKRYNFGYTLELMHFLCGVWKEFFAPNAGPSVLGPPVAPPGFRLPGGSPVAPPGADLAATANKRGPGRPKNSQNKKPSLKRQQAANAVGGGGGVLQNAVRGGGGAKAGVGKWLERVAWQPGGVVFMGKRTTFK